MDEQYLSWQAVQETRWQGIDAIMIWNLPLTPLDSILRAVELYATGQFSLGRAGQEAGAHKLALMAALHLRQGTGALTEVERHAIEQAYHQARKTLLSEAEEAIPAEEQPITSEELQAIMALAQESLARPETRLSRREFLDQVQRHLAAPK